MRWKLDLLIRPRNKRQSTQWKHASSSRPKKARQSKSTHKLQMISFFDSTGMIYLHWVPTGQTVKKEYYVEVLREFGKIFHQDNSPVHNSIHVTQYLTKMGIKTVPQHPYSPDLAPCDFWLFPKLSEAMTKVSDTLTQEDLHGAFQKVLERYKCISAGGDYFKGD